MVVAVVGHRFANLDAEREVLSAVDADLVDLREEPLSRILEVSARADAILLGTRFRFDRGRLTALRRCRVISRYGVGVDNVDLQAASELGIRVTCVPDYCVEEVANHAITLLLALNRHVVEFNEGMRSESTARSRLEIRRLSDCTLGILGFGRIGAEVAKRARAFGVTMAIHDPLRSASDIEALGEKPLR
jgi:D-3-phosphoglycerate dehydrogenase